MCLSDTQDEDFKYSEYILYVLSTNINVDVKGKRKRVNKAIDIAVDIDRGKANLMDKAKRVEGAKISELVEEEDVDVDVEVEVAPLYTPIYTILHAPCSDAIAVKQLSNAHNGLRIYSKCVSH